ncbi:hypothetical protein B9Z65_8098 [Elsinoe australis]|uniref:Uncharacterized protein n=1 Tax=Elsinoe australis TaxID=40998 RepID=A0A2P7YW11_9PEZI|nr:hypothetical protein B9Z65_8098 [Elsinoe australis]
MSHSFSKSWKSPAVVAREHWSRILKSREHLCPESPFLPRVFDQVQHKIAVQQARDDLEAAKAECTTQDATVMARNALDRTHVLPLHGRTMTDPLRSNVLCLPTIWSQEAELHREFTAPWPTIAEMKYEGDERIATSVDHRRFLPVPRYPSDVPGMNWSEIAFLPQAELDEVGKVNEEEAFFLSHDVEEREISDEEGEHLLGKDLMAMLDTDHMFTVEEKTMTKAKKRSG